jgi:hypothetical protein
MVPQYGSVGAVIRYTRPPPWCADFRPGTYSWSTAFVPDLVRVQHRPRHQRRPLRGLLADHHLVGAAEASPGHDREVCAHVLAEDQATQVAVAAKAQHRELSGVRLGEALEVDQEWHVLGELVRVVERLVLAIDSMNGALARGRRGPPRGRR